jgi:tRNA threonylcarbamoyladenosine biosynthesis protein TsaB
VASPLTLALDVSGAGGGVALYGPDGVLVRALAPDIRRGRDLVPLIQALLQEASLAPADLDLVACGIGPGSFTGIRIGVATAAAFAFAAGLPALGVGSLHGRAAHAPKDAEAVLVVLNARRGQLFAGLFPARGEPEPYRLATPDELVRGLPAATVVLGEGRDLFPEHFERFPGTADAPPRPDAIARIAAQRFEAGERGEPAQLHPLYMRASEPELRRR